ncbi:MAG: NAD-dependent epimerase/dehydratase family protein [Actinobacteria bacterium]|nr:NAD-dependent epimerase/dehydratase family protein [Actinomycetota bacterium]
MRVLVTGGAGFIGSHIVDQLVERGDHVRVIDLLHPKAHHAMPAYLNDDAEYLFADLRETSVVTGALAGIDAVCHQAAMVGLGVDFGDVTGYVDHNDRATAALLGCLHAAGFDGRIVLASSMVVYGDGQYRCSAHGVVRALPRSAHDLAAGRYEPSCPSCGAALGAEPVTEAAAADPRNIYAATKLHQEHLCAAYGREHGSPVIALRYHNVYGPRMPRDTPYAGVAAIFRSAVEGGRAPQVFEDGRQRRDFIHVDDVARANLAALDAPAHASGAFNIATGESHTVLEMASALCSAIAPGSSLEPAVVGGGRVGDVRHVFASPDLARQTLHFCSRVPFGDGMLRFATDPLRA